MTSKEFLDSLPDERRKILSELRSYILEADPLVSEFVGKMMGNEMLIYSQGDFFKYALASTKDHLSLHSMVIYFSATKFAGSGMRERYMKLLPDVKFQ